MTELPKHYDPQTVEGRVFEGWLEAECFAARPDERPWDQRYVVMMPLPNVTGALHMGHAMDNVMQDLLIRWHRMQGDNTLWMAGTDHAGIATQAVVEKRLKENENLTRHDVGREALVERIWAWKDEYQARIVKQQQAMGCSCDWDRQRFTMDAVCARAVRETFFRLFKDGLIYRGDRLVNWDCHLQTAVSDDEVYHETVQGHFWHLRYPVLDPQPSEPEYVVVATTRPETMLGDTAVACHPDPAGALAKKIAEQEAKLAEASEKDRPLAEKELERLRQRQREVLPRLERLRDMAQAGRQLTLPLQNRVIPLITDEWAKPELGSGCVKITPAHDPNDYEVWTRHKDQVGVINILGSDGTLNEQAGAYQGLDRFEARQRVVADLEGQGLLDQVEEREVEIGHSDRSKTPVEPYLSKQWFVRMGDLEGGVTLGRGTPKEHTAPGLAQAAVDACGDTGYRSPSGLTLSFFPDGDRYQGTYTSWLGEKRDWCISRQLWWGHRIPVWWKSCPDADELGRLTSQLSGLGDDLHAWIGTADGTQRELAEGLHYAAQHPTAGPFELQACPRSLAADEQFASALEGLGLARDPDVLDTWFSSALWPFSTLGWPDPETAPLDPGQSPTAAQGGFENTCDYYFPGSCLVTGRDIITLWVARMVIMGLYNLGDLPFHDVFIHAKIMDGKGLTMSKTKGNGADPVDIIQRYGADAMRYVICDMQTGMQDIRLPVQAACPACDHVNELAETKHGQTIFTYLCQSCGAEFDVLGTMQDKGIPGATVFSNRFEVGQHFCNKLWNAARFTLMNLASEDGAQPEWRPLSLDELEPEDLWLQARLGHARDEVTKALADYAPSVALTAARRFFRDELCDWYLELIKPRMRDPRLAPIARQVLAFSLDHALRLMHPFIPFVTEEVWRHLAEVAPQRGITKPAAVTAQLALAPWPQPGPEWIEAAAQTHLEDDFATMQDAVRKLRDLRQQHGVPPNKPLPAAAKASGREGAALERLREHVVRMAKLASLEVGPAQDKLPNSATAVFGESELYLGDVLDPEKERARLEGQKNKLSGQIMGSEKKLGNEGFVAKAPPQVVEAERQRLSDLQSQLQLVEASLAELG